MRVNVRQIKDDRFRLSVYRSLNNLFAQIIDDKSSKTLVSANSLKLKGSLSKKAEEVAKLLSEAAKAKKIKKVSFDRGRFAYKGAIKTLSEAARKAGLDF